MNKAQLFEVFFFTALISYLMTPFLRQVAFKIGWLDKPKSNKVHAKPVPLLGGVAIFLSFFIVSALTAVRHTPHIVFIFIGCLILVGVGLIDDKFGMMPKMKLLAQILAAMLVIKAGLRVNFFSNYYFNVLFTYVWIIGITNSFNLLDNMNGLSAGIAAISSLFFGIVCFIEGQTLAAGFSFALAGANLGFLKHNFPKARIFMGDSGSLIIGYLLGILAIWSSWQIRQINPSLVVPLLVLSYPIFDTTLVTIMRVIEKRPIFEGGKDHSSHRLALLGLKKMRAVLVIYAICIASGIAGVIVAKSNIYAGVAVAAVVFGLFFILGIRLSFIKTYQHGHRKKNVTE